MPYEVTQKKNGSWGWKLGSKSGKGETREEAVAGALLHREEAGGVDAVWVVRSDGSLAGEVANALSESEGGQSVDIEPAGEDGTA